MTVYTLFTYIGIAALLLTALRYFIKKPGNWVLTYFQNFVGSLFIFSGFVKAVDPLGTGYKMHEYFESFMTDFPQYNKFWDWSATMATPMAIGMIALEVFLGFMLIIGWQKRLTIALIYALTLFFTLLTGYTYLSGYTISPGFIGLSALVLFLFFTACFPKKQNQRLMLAGAGFAGLLIAFAIAKFGDGFIGPQFKENGMRVTDCGCFGDFIKLKPWQTFYKDVFLDFVILLLVIYIDKIDELFTNVSRHALAGVLGAFSLGLCLYCTFMNEPIIDFRPYAVGENIPANMEVKRQPVIKMTYPYKNQKTGEIVNITSDSIGNEKYKPITYDTTGLWKPGERIDDVLDEGIPARISNLMIENPEIGDVTGDLFADPNYSLMVIMWTLKGTHTEAFKELNDIASKCDKAGIKFYAISSGDADVEEFRHKYQTAYPFLLADATPLKTMIRSNPGLILFKNGTVINKWHYKHLPTFEELNAEYFKK
jgi:uncharacterized membrane protein YphA (DoxX/SURF4 family)